jgi:allophanate hydrolase subunit 1
MLRRPYGPMAWLIDDVESPAAWAEALGAMGVPGVEEIVPAESTVVVRCTRGRHGAIGEVLDIVVPADRPARRETALTLDVVYDGPDIAELAQVARVSIDDVVRLHVTGTYDVAFCGFSPGFGYLRGIDARLTCRDVRRRAPRCRQVRSGSPPATPVSTRRRRRAAGI